MKKGDTLTISYPEKTIQISFWGDEIESIRENNEERETFEVHALKELDTT